MQNNTENLETPNPLQTFEFEGKKVRVIKTAEGRLLFVATDICVILGYKNVSDVLGRLGSDGVVSNYPIPDKLGRPQPTNMLTEAGLENLIEGSRKAESKHFGAWVKAEITQKSRFLMHYLPDLQAFVFEDEGFLRMFLDEFSNPWFVALDVCKILEYANPSDAVARHCKGDTIVKH